MVEAAEVARAEAEKRQLEARAAELGDMQPKDGVPPPRCYIATSDRNIQSISGGRGAVVMSSTLFIQELKAAKREARLLAIGFASGDVPQVPANHLLVKNVDVIGVYWGGYLKFAPEALTESLAELLDWYSQGRLKPHVSHVLTLDQAAEGIDLLASRKSTGKVVITP